jgi:hypothetical protein
MLSASATEEPNTIDDALRDPWWVAAMDAEYNALLQNKTWHLVPAPKGKECDWLQMGL